MNKACAVEQHIKSSSSAASLFTSLVFKHVQPAGVNAGPIFAQVCQGGLVDISGPDRRAFVGERERGCASNALGGCRQQRNFSG